jgi:hypothetical protein
MAIARMCQRYERGGETASLPVFAAAARQGRKIVPSLPIKAGLLWSARDFARSGEAKQTKDKSVRHGRIIARICPNVEDVRHARRGGSATSPRQQSAIEFPVIQIFVSDDQRICHKGDLWPAPTVGAFPMTGKIPQTETVGNGAYYGKHR